MMAKKLRTKVLNYRVIIEKEHYDDGTPVYSTQVPTLGISDYGPNIEKALENTKECIKFHIECLIEEGEKVPLPDDVYNSLVTNSQVEIVPSKRLEFAFA